MKNATSLIVFVSGLSLAIHAAAQAQDGAENLDILLRQMEPLSEAGRREIDVLEEEFTREPERMAALLEEMQRQRDEEAARSDSLEAQFEDRELQIADINGQFEVRLGPMRELLGVLQQVASRTNESFSVSITNVEYPGRGEFLSRFVEKMGSGDQLPTIEEIERLWFELQREATALGKIRRLRDFEVVSADGQRSYEDVVRIGGFNLIADGRYFTHNPETNSILELQRQPGDSLLVSSVSNLINADPGDPLVGFGLDPTGGIILGFLAETPTVWDRVGQGRIVGYVIITLGFFGLLLSFERVVYLGLAGRKVRTQLRQDEPSDDNALGRVLLVYRENPDADPETLELKLGEAILKETPPLNRGILFVKIISVVAPLLGLLGTVTGMIDTFQAITLFGTGDPRMMADGISQALVTTALGLTVAIPMVLLYTVVSGQSRRIIHTLQEHSAGIVATQAADQGTSGPRET